MIKKLAIIILILLVFGLIFLNKERTKAKKGGAMDFRIKSDVFKEGEVIPEKYSCEGEDVSPPLKWENVPDEAQSLALIADDPDAPMGTWVHWVIFNIPTSITDLEENIPAQEELSNGAKQGRNGFKKIGYGGPCPPPGSAHRYYFKLYALDKKLELSSGVTKSDLVDAMEGHIISKAELIGKYSR